jgi:molybdate transport system substrate-binding protein
MRRGLSRLSALCAGVLLLLLPSLLPASARAAEISVAAAADLQFALAEVAARFTAATGQRVRLSFGSSGNYARQIARGAPFDLYFSANESYVEHLVAAGLTRDGGRIYGHGRLVLYIAAGRDLDPDTPLADLAAQPGLRRLAIANPDHAPYGAAARAALLQAGSWDALTDRLVFGENASQATQFVSSAAADAGLVPYALVLAPQLAGRGRYRLLPADAHPPLRQRVVLLAGASAGAAAFYAFVAGPEAHAILARYGFDPGSD